MSIQLLSVSHKAAPLAIRQLFAFSNEQQLAIMKSLRESKIINEAIVLSTCNRTEIYVYSELENERKVYDVMIQVVTEMAKENERLKKQIFTQQKEHIQESKVEEESYLGDYYRFYHGEKAIHHLFDVTAGLDSMVIGEDQILGQVKRAHEFARKHGMCGTYLNTFFRYCVTGSKRVKTETELSKTSVSTATLAVKVLQEQLQTLKDKNIMVIGSTGKIGTIVLKNLQSIGGMNLYVTMRGISATKNLEEQPKNIKSCPCNPEEETSYTIIPYEERYHYMDKMDGVISATASPHYTITKGHFKRYYKGNKMVFVDLAVPMDIEHQITQLDGIVCYHMDDLEQSAKENNERKKEETVYAKRILKDYETQFKKWFLFQRSWEAIQEVTDHLEVEVEKKGVKKALNQFFYQVREDSTPEQLEQFLGAVLQYKEKEIEEK